MEKKPIRLNFAEATSTKNNVARPPIKQPQPQPNASAVRPAKPKPTVIGTEQVRARCSHLMAFEIFARDPFREERRTNHEGRDCKDCAAARIKAEQEAAILRRKQKKIRERLPDRSAFHVEYDATTVRWRGTLNTLVNGKPEVFSAEASAVFQLLRKLDNAYRRCGFAAEVPPPS